jgi:hypothetical protein
LVTGRGDSSVKLSGVAQRACIQHASSFSAAIERGCWIGANHAQNCLLTRIAASAATAFLIIMAMTFGLTLPRTPFERGPPRRHEKRHGRSIHRTAVQD